MKRFAVLFLLLALLATQGLFAQKSSTLSKMGIGMNVGFQKLYGESQVDPTGFAPAGEVLAKYMLSDRINISVGLGFGLLNDGPLTSTFNTNLITGDLKLNVNLLPQSKINPFVTFGLGAFSFQFTQVEAQSRNGDPYPPDYPQRYFDGSFFAGGGLEYSLTDRIGINAFADYRFTTGDDLDGFTTGAEKDGYLNGRAGMTYYFSPQGQRTETSNDLIALESVDVGDLGQFEELGLPNVGDEELGMFETRLDKLEEGDAGFSMEHYIRLKSRVDELNHLIMEKETSLEDLRTSLDLKDQRISDLETELDRMGTGGYRGPINVNDFTTGYEDALRNYYSRSFSYAVGMFQALRDSYPNHRLTSNAQYWIGECQFGLGNYAAATEAFQSVFNYSASFKRDDATIMLGRCYYQLNDYNTAKSYFQDLINNYPESEYIPKAQSWLGRI
jgi:tol-pal system protein YbgF